MSVPDIKKKEQNARLLEFGEDVKKKLCFLSEVVPDGTVKFGVNIASQK